MLNEEKRGGKASPSEPFLKVDSKRSKEKEGGGRRAGGQEQEGGGIKQRGGGDEGMKK